MEKTEENKSNDQLLNISAFTQKEIENLYIIASQNKLKNMIKLN